MEDRLRAKNNLLRESRTGNFRKKNYLKRDYDEIRAHVRNNHMPKEYVDQDLVLKPYNPALEIRTAHVAPKEWEEGDEEDDEDDEV